MALVYSLNAGGTSYSVVSNSCTIGAVTIPSTHNGLPVTSIGNNAFYQCLTLTSIIIPNSLTSIGVGALSSCLNLTSITIGNSVTSIGNDAFYGCISLTSITIPNSVTTIGNSAFRDCSNLASVTFAPTSIVTSIGVGVFFNCSALTSITIPNSVNSFGTSVFFGCILLNSVTFQPTSIATSITNTMFYNCSSLTSITIPNSVISIGSSAFSGCTSLTSITIGNSVNSIVSNAFSGCPQLASISVNATNSNFTSEENVLFNKLKTTLVRYPQGKSGSTYEIPNSVTSIGSNAFQECTNLASITIPNSVISIGSSAFSGCTSLASITIPNSVNSLGFAVFINCNGLTSVTIGSGVTIIGSGTFYQCTGLTSITIPSNVTSIVDQMFYQCTSLVSITIPKSVTSIGALAFRACTSLVSITIPDSVTTIGDQGFVFCTSLMRINFLGNAPTLGSTVFQQASVNLKIYRKKNFVTGWSSTLGGKPVVLWSDNIIKNGGSGKLITSIYNSDALKYIQLIESLTSPNNPITQDSKNKINSFIKQIKQIVPWNNFTAWTFIRGQNAFPPFLDSTDNRYNGIVKAFGGLGGGEVISANSSTSNGDEGLSFSSPAGVLSISPSSFFTSVKSIFGVFKPTDNYYYIGTIDQNIFSVRGGPSGLISSSYYSALYYKLDAVYSRITRNSILDIQRNSSPISVFNLNFYKSLGTVFDANSTSNYSNGIKQFTASPLSVPNASLLNGVSIGGGIVNGGTIPFVFVSDLVLTDAQMLAIHNIYKSTLGASLTNSQL